MILFLCSFGDKFPFCCLSIFYSFAEVLCKWTTFLHFPHVFLNDKFAFWGLLYFVIFVHRRVGCNDFSLLGTGRISLIFGKRGTEAVTFQFGFTKYFWSPRDLSSCAL